MTTEIVTGIDGRQYELEYEGTLSPEDRNEVLLGLGCSTCANKQSIQSAGSIQTLGTCNTTRKIYGVDTTISLTSVPTGTGPTFTVQFKKDGVNIGTPITTSPYTYNYTILSTDAGLTGTTYNFTATVSDSCAGSVPVTDPGCPVTIYNVLSTPVITGPTSAIVGTGVTFTCSALTGGSGSGYAYQWKKGGVNISGATSSTYSIVSVVTGDAGSYTVEVSNATSGQTKLSAAQVLSISCATIGVGLTVA